jgi:hypothetical protein
MSYGKLLIRGAHESTIVHTIAQKNIGHRSSQSQRVGVRWSGLGGQGPFAQLASRLFSPRTVFSPELETGEEKILKRNPAKKKRPVLNRLSNTNFNQVDG